MASSLIRKLGVLLVLAALAAPAAADPITAPIVPQISTGELQNLRSRQQRLDFQQRQQFNRELDNLAIQRQPRLRVPVMKPHCRLQTSGTPRTCENDLLTKRRRRD
jgi:hypothetical protein